MVRTSKNQPSSLDAGALDDLDLDDMFADDGDMLFEGLDIQLEGMGDIITTESKQKGPKVDATATTPKRRKTKRKSKTPVAFGDEDDDYVEEQQPKKKRKSSAKSGKAVAAPPPAPIAATTTTTKKKKMKKGDAAAAPTSSKSKNKLTGASMIPPPSTVAAAGRFGKRGSGSGKATKRKSKSSGSGVEGATPSMPAPPPLYIPKQESNYGGLHPSKTHFYPFLESVPPEPSLKNRKQFPNFDKVFQTLNTVLNQASGQSGNGAPILPDTAAALAAGLDMESPIVQLLLESYEGISEKDKQSFGDQKKQALLGCIPELKKSIEGMDQMKLLADLYGMCGLLTRQFHFVNTSLTNMDAWCKEKFTDSDYRQAYSLPEPFRPEKVGTIITPANRKWRKPIISVKVVFAGYKEPKGTPVLQARMPPSLVLPPKKEAPSTTASATATTKTKKKKSTTKSSAASTSTTKSAAPAAPVVPKAPAAPKVYADCPPPERRQRILERVAQLALGLESQLNFRRTNKRSPTTPGANSTSSSTAATSKAAAAAVNKTTGSVIPLEDPPLHTARMWEWLEAAGFFQSKNAARQLRLQSPEIYPRGLLLPTPTRIKGRQEPETIATTTTIEGVEEKDDAESKLKDTEGEGKDEEPKLEDTEGEGKDEEPKLKDREGEEKDKESKLKDKEETLIPISSNGLFDRLQSLLVVEEDDQEGDKKDYARYDDDSDMETDSDSDDEEPLNFLDEDSDEEYDNVENPTRPLADLSKLSKEERTFLHLCSVGLIKKSSFPLVELVLEDDQKGEAMEDDLVNVIGEMSTDLSTLTVRNNARIAYLESTMNPTDVAFKKQLEEEQTSIIARCQSLLKRSKERAKKSNKQKISGGSGNGSNKDDLNLPW
jgi:hypothetical protein